MPTPQHSRICCELCDESFNKSHHFEYHLNKVHLKEAPYLCNVCKKTFFSDFALTTHMGRRLHFSSAEERLLDVREDQSFFDAGSQAVRWKCMNCRHTSKSKTALRFHVANAHVPPRGKYLCRRCGRGFMQGPAFEAHMNMEHTKRSSYPCDDCDKTFVSRAAMRAHKLAKQRGEVEPNQEGTPRKSSTPPIGAASSVFPAFGREHPLLNHKGEAGPAHIRGATHAPPQAPGHAPVIACPLCLMLFPSEGGLIQHQRSGSCPGAMTHFNPFAAAAVASQQQHGPPPPHHVPPRHPLLDGRPPMMTHHHMGVHPHHMHPPPSPASAHAAIMMNQIKSFLCRTCGEAYRTKDALDRHLWLVHSIKAENVVIYRCDECGKEYTKKQRYDTHMMLHRGERPHRCPYCKYDTNIRGNLRLHVKNVHKVELPLMRRKRGQD